MREKQRSGRYAWRVRVAGNKAKKIAIGVGPEHPEFTRRYEMARRGEKPDPLVESTHIPQSLEWLAAKFEKAMEERVNTGQMHPNTRKQRMAFLNALCARYGDKHMAMPRAKVIEHRDSLRATPGAADNAVKTIRALYAWAIDMGHVKENPAASIPKINTGKGATPWSVDDLRRFRECHPIGTVAHLALTLFMFTACRISDAHRLGRANEVRRDGVLYLDWQPAKKGSARVVVPILPPLARAIEQQKVVGPTYLLNSWGRPFASPAAFGNWFRDRVREAGLEDRSPHGIRKAAGEILALEGATQYHIMAIHGHTQAKTSEVYTAGVNRQRLAEEAMAKLANLDW
jgi:integrase